MKDNQGSPWKAAGLVSAIGVDLGVCVCLGFFGGKYIFDATGQIFWLPLGIIAGLAAGISSVILLVKRFLGDGHG